MEIRSSGMQDSFWDEILMGADPAFAAPILPAMISVRQWNNSGSWRDKRSDLRRIQQIARENLLSDDPQGGCIRLDESHLLVIMTEPERFKDPVASCHDLISSCGKELMCEISCLIGEVTFAKELISVADQLFELERKNVSNRPILRMSLPTSHQNISSELLEKCSYLLQDEQFDQMLILLSDYFQQETLLLNADSLYRFNQDFLQMLYSTMRTKQISAHVLFQRRENADLFRDAPNSIGNTVTWIFCAVTALSLYLEQRHRSENYTQQAMSFILSNLSRNFTRQEIADYVHLSQNHLARLFRQETRMSISDYILQERMKLAFGLLKNTSLPVGEVALQAGYENYSYFLTLFRRVAGMTPSQYREKYSGHSPTGGTDHAK